MIRPKCVNPVLIVNQVALLAIAHGGVCHMDGSVVNMSRRDIDNFNWFALKQSLLTADDDILSSYYVDYQGRTEYLLMFVGCGKCELCRHSKQIDLINRSILETLSWDCPPYFVTLTYRDEDLPYRSVYGDRILLNPQLCYKDVQDFFKRLRIRWSRKGLAHDVRYLVAGEYGSKHYPYRPHYHIIMWNNPYAADEFKPLQHDSFCDDVFEAWGKCTRAAFDFGQCRGGAAPYATKYVSKPPFCPNKWIKPFIHTSTGHGGLGSRYIDANIQYYRDNPLINYFEYVDKKGLYGYMYFSKSIANRIYPSPSRCVSPRLKQYYREVCDVLQQLVDVNALSTHDAAGLSEVLLPAPNVMRPKYFKFQRHYIFGFAKTLYIKRLFGILDALAFDLSELTDVPSDYITLYYKHIDAIELPINLHLGTKVSKISERIAVITDKSTL